jgi:hypothetical protein
VAWCIVTISSGIVGFPLPLTNRVTAPAMFDVFDDDADDCQLGNEILVSEAGFGIVEADSRTDA